MRAKIQPLSLKSFYENYRVKLDIDLLTSPATLSGVIDNNEVSRPGVVISGFTERFAYHRCQVFGETEIMYLKELEDVQLKENLQKMASFKIPAVFVSKWLDPPDLFNDIFENSSIPVFRTHSNTQEFQRRLSDFLDDYFAPVEHVHGTLADVFGVGILYTGPSGIGKSECVLDMVERGHRLICDDVVRIKKVGDHTVIGMVNEKLGHHMEIRGLGVIDVFKLFGIRSVRDSKSIEVVVRLEKWDDGVIYERSGLDEMKTKILDVDLPLLRIPLVPGKNITVISEVIAMNYLLKLRGHNSAEEFNRRLLEQMKDNTYITRLSELDEFKG